MNNEIYNKDLKTFLGYIAIIWASRKSITIWILSFGLFGFGIARVSTNIYTSKSVFVPQIEQGSGNLENLGGLASLAGINVGSMSKSTEIPPDLYPELIKSINFKRDLINAELFVNEGQIMTYQEYYNDFNNRNTVKNFIGGLPLRLYRMIGPRKVIASVDSLGYGGIEFISNDEEKHLERVTKQLNLKVKKKEGIVELSFSMPDPFLSAKMTQIAEELLQKKIINYRIQAAQQQLEFTNQRYLESKRTFELIQDKRASFSDENRNLSTESARSGQNRIDSEYDIAFSVFKELAGQLEQAKIQVNKDTPVFMNIQPIVIPQQKSKPKSLLIIISLMVIGFLIPASFVIVKQILNLSKNGLIG